MAKTKTNYPKKDPYRVITNRMCELIEETGLLPWAQPWTGGSASGSINAQTEKSYSGINRWVLSMTTAARGYSVPVYCTYNQARQLGGQVRKGEKGTPIIKMVTGYRRPDPQDPDQKETVSYSRPIIKHYTVFNSDQIDWETLPDACLPHLYDQPKPRPEWGNAAADCIVGCITDPPTITHGGGGAFYRPSSDVVNLPERGAFRSEAEYYSTLFHELTHSTGIPGRCDRFKPSETPQFGSVQYSKEELVAEFGACFLCHEAGIENEQAQRNSAAYLKGWVRKLKGEERWLVSAARQAETAASHILAGYEAYKNEAGTLAA